VDEQIVEKDGMVTEPGEPVSTSGRISIVEGLYRGNTEALYDIFGGWYREPGCTTPWDFNTDTVSGDTTLYALWTPSTPVITISGQTGNNIVEQAVDYVKTRPPAAYTLMLDSDVTDVGIQVLSVTGITLTITTRDDTERSISKGTETGYLFMIGAAASTLKLEGHIALQGKIANTGSLVNVTNGGALIMSGHSKITGNEYTVSYGGGVSIMSNSSLSMYDYAEISNNQVTGSAGNIYGGGVYIQGASLIMHGNAAIKNNTVRHTGGNNANGGGVFMQSGNFVMDGHAAVSNNTAQSNSGDTNGGGVYVQGTCTMYEQSVVTDNQLDGSATKRGGGVYIAGTFNLNTDAELGSLTGNDANGGSGDQVYKELGRTFNINGATAADPDGTGSGNEWWD
jgi:hypothetical protein